MKAQTARKPAIIKRLVNFCWSCFKGCVTLAVIAALALMVYIYLQLDSEIRRHIEQKIARHYPNLDVRVASARRVGGEGIEIRGLSITDPTLEGPAATLLAVDEIFVVCGTDLVKLTQNGPNICRLTIRRPTVRAIWRPDKTWSVARLLPLPKFGPRSPPSVVEQATVELFDPRQAATRASPTLTFRNINLTLTPAEPAVPGATGRQPLEVQGTLASDFFRQASVRGLFDPESSRWKLAGKAENIQVGPDLYEACRGSAVGLDAHGSGWPFALRPTHARATPAHFAEPPPFTQAFQARATVDFELDQDPSREPAFQFAVMAQLDQGRCEDARLPEALTDVRATIQANNRRLAIEGLSASYGPATLRLSCQRLGWRPDSHIVLTADAQSLQLTPALFAALPERLRRIWHKFQPLGQINTAVKLTFDGTAWHPNAVVRLNDVSLTFDKFPYRVDRGAGTVNVKANTVDFDLVAHSGNQPVHIQGQLVDPGPDWTGGVRIHGRNITADERLIGALPGKGRQVIRSLNSSGGRFHFDWQCWRERAGPSKPCHRLDLELVGGSIRYDKFPYPLDNVQGIVQWIDRRWTFGNLTATNDTGRVELSGRLVPIEHAHELVLDIKAWDVPLDEELHGALRPEVQRAWDNLKPRGRISVTAHVRNVTGQAVPEVTAVIAPIPEGASIDPVHFQLHLDNLRGAIKYKNGQVGWDNLRGRHGGTGFATTGHYQVHPDGHWQLDFSKLDVDRLRGDRDLLAALPAGLRRMVSRLAPTGSMNMAGSLRLVGDGGPRAPVASRWDLRLDLQETDIDCGLELTNLRGSVRLKGTSDGRRFQTRDELDIDSMNYRGFQLTEVRGPMRVEDERVLLGTWVGREEGSTPRHLTAKLHGGTVSGDGWVALNNRPRFAIQAALTDGDLARFAQESARKQHRLKGKVYANVALQGTGQSVHTLAGSGTIQLRDADIYELPVMVALLKVLNARLPDTKAFSESDMRFRVQGDHLYFDQLDLMGDAVNLYGKGTVDFQKNLHLVFHTNFRRSDLPMPIVRSVLGQASQQILQVHVDGSFDNPQIRNEAFPVMNQALQQLQADLGAAERQTRRPDRPRWLPWNPPQTPR